MGSYARKLQVISRKPKQDAERKSCADFPKVGGVEFSQTETPMLLWSQERPFQVQYRLQNRSLVPVREPPAITPEALQERDRQRFLFISFFKNRTAAAADGNVTRGSESMILINRRAW